MSVHEENENVTESAITESLTENTQTAKTTETVPIQITQQSSPVLSKEDDPCKDKEPPPVQKETEICTVGLDPRFQHQNQTLRCYVMYTDFYRCEKILGEGAEACAWFKKAFNTICPLDWIQVWDKRRIEGRFPWFKEDTQGIFPGNKYGE